MNALLDITDWRHPYVIDGQPVRLAKEWYAHWHPWRWSIDLPVINQAVGALEGKTLVDTGCNDGWYGFQAAAAGASVTGIDARADAIQRANLLKAATSAENIEFIVGNLEDMVPQGKSYDVTLFYGLLYHLSDPINVLYRMGQITKRIICVQTFIHALDPNPTLHLLRESPDLPGKAVSELITTPTQRAIVMMLHNAGFDHVYRAMPRPYRNWAGNRAHWQWAFFYGVKEAPLKTSSILRHLGEFDRPMNSFGPVAKLRGYAEQAARRWLKKDIRGGY